MKKIKEKFEVGSGSYPDLLHGYDYIELSMRGGEFLSSHNLQEKNIIVRNYPTKKAKITAKLVGSDGNFMKFRSGDRRFRLCQAELHKYFPEGTYEYLYIQVKK